MKVVMRRFFLHPWNLLEFFLQYGIYILDTVNEKLHQVERLMSRNRIIFTVLIEATKRII